MMNKKIMNTRVVRIIGSVLVLSLIPISCFFNFSIKEGLNHSMFVIGIMAVSGSILAVGLTVFQAMLSDISKTYNPEVQQLITNAQNSNFTFYLFIATIITCVLFIFVQEPYVNLMTITIVTIFLLSLFYFILALSGISSIRNPIAIIDFMHDTIIKGLEKD